MLVLGLILVLVAAGAVVAVVLSGTGDQAAMFGGDLHLPTLVVFLAGAATLLVLLLGLALVRTGLRRASRSRKDTRRLRKLERREAGGSTRDPAGAGAGRADDAPYQSPSPPTR